MRNTTQRNLIIKALTSDLGGITVWADEALSARQARKLADEGVLVRIDSHSSRHYGINGKCTHLFSTTYRLRVIADGTDIAEARAMAQRQKHHELQEAYAALAKAQSKSHAAKISHTRKLIALLHAEQDAITKLIRQAA